MADVNPDKLQYSFEQPQEDLRGKDNIDVPAERKFIGFDGYKQAMDALKPGDIVILATPPGFRWVAVHLRHRKGAQRLHGEAGDRRRPDERPDAGAEQEGAGEEPQGRASA